MSSVKISAVLGNSQRLDGGSMFGNAPRAVWQKWIEPDELGRIPLACRALLIEAEGRKILCETGIGAFFEPKLAERFGVQNPDQHLLRENLQKLGIEENEIDYVILSHLHFDHAGGLLPTYQEMQEGHDELLFPKAEYLVGKEAYERALHPHFRDRASFIPGLTEKLQNSGRLRIIEGEKCPGVFDDRLSFFMSEGHTPGQMHTVFRGDQTKVCFAGDLIPGEPWIHLPITMGYDRFPERLIEEKENLYQQAVTEKWWIFLTHDPKTSCTRVSKSEKGRFQATDSVSQPVQLPI